MLTLAKANPEGAMQVSDRALRLIETYAVPAVAALVMLIVAFIVAGWAGALVRRGCERSKVDIMLARFLGKITRWVVLILALLSILSYFGVQTTGFAAVIGGGALAVGLAFQGTLSNFAAGVMLLVFRPFKVEDVVTIAGETGKVFEIDLISTTLDTPDNRRIIVPNGSIFGSTIQNITHHDTRRVDVAVGVEYPADMDRTRQVLTEAVQGIEGVLCEPEPVIYLAELADSSVNWAVRVWSATDDYWAVRERLTRAVKLALDQADIGIPFPQMDVHLDKALV